jgi:hypothetical protein
MELKDVILSTLAEMEDAPSEPMVKELVEEKKEKPTQEKVVQEEKVVVKETSLSALDEEMIYLNSIRERLLVLFEGFQAPNNTNIEAKVDMTLNFLEYVLATIDSRVEVLKKGSSK